MSYYSKSEQLSMNISLFAIGRSLSILQNHKSGFIICFLKFKPKQ